MYVSSIVETPATLPRMKTFNKFSPALKCGIQVLLFPNFNNTGLGLISSLVTSHDKRTRLFSSLHFEDHVTSSEEEIAIALGSNIGNRIQNFNEALTLMKKSGINIKRHGCLYETQPAYVVDQPLFLNSAIRATTKLGPQDLLSVLKEIEIKLGRTEGIRYGPRPIDLDILFYGKRRIESETLTIPHERIWERPFVVAPLVDLLGSSMDDNTEKYWHSFTNCSMGLFDVWEKLGGESLIRNKEMTRVMPVRNSLVDWSKKTHVMGILNVTPDSCSDGGKFLKVEDAVHQVKRMIFEGADIIDIGAQSTRPGAQRVSADDELKRLVPVLDAVFEMPEIEGKIVSVDTFYAEVAYEAVRRGVHIVNDVSGGRIDPKMLSTVGELGVPYISMHMRGDPSTMQNDDNTKYGDVCKEVASELYERVNEAELAGIPAWRIIIDPGIGFSKKSEDNMKLLVGAKSIRREMGKMSVAASHAPILVGHSRKMFLREICDRKDPSEGDAATTAVIPRVIESGANIIRVHNVRDCVDAARVGEALLRQFHAFEH